jgi:hypothetical protein
LGRYESWKSRRGWSSSAGGARLFHLKPPAPRGFRGGERLLLRGGEVERRFGDADLDRSSGMVDLGVMMSLCWC